MSTWRFLIVVTITTMLALVLGCSSGNVPVTPENNAGSLDSVPVIGLTTAGDTFDAVGLLGAYEVIADPATQTVDLVPKRTTAIGEAYIVSGLGFFTVAPCSDCLKLTGFSFDMSTLTLSFYIKHPFNPGNPAEPPTAANRNDLKVFDLAATIDFDELTLPTNFPLLGVDAYTGLCSSPSGYTRDLADLLGEDAALPYFLVVDDSIDEDPPASTNNAFPQGAEDNFDISFALTGGPLLFDMYLLMGYGASAKKMQRLTPKYFVPEFNKKPAWKVNVIPPAPCEMGYTWQDNDSTTPFDVTVEVFDWQVGAPVYGGDPLTYGDDGLETEVFTSSEVESVSVDIPGMTLTLATETVADSGTGTPDDPLIYTVPVANEALAAPGDYLGLVEVLDARAPGAIGDRDFMIDSPDGVALINYTVPVMATYKDFIACVVQGCGPITGQIDTPTCPIADAENGVVIDFTVSAASGNGGDPIVLYEVDYDYDGVTYDIDDSNATGVFTHHEFFAPDPCEDNIPYTLTVAFRATDSCDPANITIFATCDVTITTCPPPCTDQTLAWNWNSCGLSYSCQGWSCGGCSTNNTDYYAWGSFTFGCNASLANNCTDITPNYLTTGGDYTSPSCSYLTDHYHTADFNVISPSLTLPVSEDGVVHFDHCNAFASGATCTVYISESDCSGPWTSLGTTPSATNCHQDTTFNIDGYESTNTMFRIRYQSSNTKYDGGNCSNAGIVVDNFTIEGCFEGTLEQNS